MFSIRRKPLVTRWQSAEPAVFWSSAGQMVLSFVGGPGVPGGPCDPARPCKPCAPCGPAGPSTPGGPYGPIGSTAPSVTSNVAAWSLLFTTTKLYVPGAKPEGSAAVSVLLPNETSVRFGGGKNHRGRPIPKD